MKKIREISSKVISTTDDGLWGGPFDFFIIMAECKVEADGKELYITGEWYDADGNIAYNVLQESVIDIHYKLRTEDLTEEEEDELTTKLDEAYGSSPAEYKEGDKMFEDFREQVNKVREMINNRIKAEEY